MSHPPQNTHSELDTKKVDDVVLALLHLNSSTEKLGPFSATQAWKSLNWDALDRLHTAGLISDPRTKAKSVALSKAGAARAERLCAELFANAAQGQPRG